MDRFEYTVSKLAPNEIETTRERGVKLYDGDTKVKLIAYNYFSVA